VEAASKAAAAAAAAAAGVAAAGPPYFSHFSALAVGKPGGAITLGYVLAGLGAVIDWDIVSGGGGGKQLPPLGVASYLLGVACRLGAFMLPTPQELVDGTPKPISFLLLSTLASTTYLSVRGRE